MSSSQFLETLRKNDLEQYYPSLFNYNITNLESLSQLTSQDLTLIGVVLYEDRKRIQRLIESVRTSAEQIGHDNLNSMGQTRVRTQVNQTSQNVGGYGSRAGVRTGRANTLSAADAQRFANQLESKLNNGGTTAHVRNNTGTYTQTTQANPSPAKQHLLKSKPSAPSNLGQRAPALDAYGVPIKAGAQATIQNRYASEFSDKIRVCVRKRPLSAKELKKSGSDIVEVKSRRSLTLHEPKLKLDMTKYTEHHGFIFDEVFDSGSDNYMVYQRTALPLVNYVFEGGKATCFAYGQTGSGKTYTMLNETCGLYFLAAQDMFKTLNAAQFKHLQIYVSFFEIYQGQLYDLLDNRKKLYAREDGKQQIVISGLREVPLNEVDNLLEVFRYGSAARSTGVTGANTDSSRSHAIMQLFLKYKNNPSKVHGKFSFIDLAGSERGADRGETNKQTRMEGSEINKSLLALKECIRALDQDKKHLPFRQSKLTQVLKDSFMGNSRTCMIGTFSPDISNSEHTLNTLRYADRVKELRRETVNDEPVDEEIDDTIEDQILLNDDDEDEEEEEDERVTADWTQSQEGSSRIDFDDDPMDIDPEFDLTKPCAAPTINAPPPKRTPIKATHTRSKSSAGNASEKLYGVGNRPTSQRPAPPSHSTSTPTKPGYQSAYGRTSSHSRSIPVPRRSPPTRSPQARSPPARSPTTKSPSALTSPKNSPPQDSLMPIIQAGPVQVPQPQPQPFTLQTVQTLAQSHRAQIKEVTDCCKDEARLLSDLTVFMSGTTYHRGSDNEVEAIFKDYLTNVDSVLERKLEAIVALRGKIKELGYN